MKQKPLTQVDEVTQSQGWTDAEKEAEGVNLRWLQRDNKQSKTNNWEQILHGRVGSTHMDDVPMDKNKNSKE